MTTTVVATYNSVTSSSAVPELEILDVKRPLVPARREVRVLIPGRAGSYRFGEEPGDGLLELVAHLQASSFAARRAAVRALAGWADIEQEGNLILSDESDRYYVATLADTANPDEWLEAAELVIPFVVSPYACAVATSSQSVTATAPSPDSDTFSIPDELSAIPVIEVTPLDGDLDTFGLTLNGDKMEYGTTVVSGDTITINSISNTVTTGVSTDTDLTGAYDAAKLSFADVTGTLPLELVSGSNAWTFEWTGTASNVKIVFTWRRRFR